MPKFRNVIAGRLSIYNNLDISTKKTDKGREVMKKFVRDMNAVIEMAELKKKIKVLEKKEKCQSLSDYEVKILSDYRGKLFSMELKEAVIKKICKN